jgi:hypothetical protein
MASRTGLDDMVRRKILPLQGLELRPLGRPARSVSLYRLRSPSCARKVFGLKGKDIMEWWRKLHNEGLRNLYSSQNSSRIMRLVGNVVRVEDMRNAYKVSAEKT